jgi:hypothetical protein
VGFSIMVLLMLNSVLPALFSWGMKALQRMMRCCTLRLVPTASQERYNALWIGREFVLCQRWVCHGSSGSCGEALVSASASAVPSLCHGDLDVAMGCYSWADCTSTPETHCVLHCI